ncbi:MAG: hypothetical protein KBE02_06405 [Sulfurospirillum sp.]|jgi:hypothetical protein|nr:hypothetical protein [Sulfurospirillum sp.]
MKNKVFISGSISIKKLPIEVKNSINKIIEKNIEILVGDASGIDTLVQEYCSSLNYFNVTVYSIYAHPRYKANENFRTKYIEVNHDIKKERNRQEFKDNAMTIDSEFLLTIWDGRSEGSYSNILRGLAHGKKIKVYLSNKDLFLNQNEITTKNIEFIYRENNGYTASEVVEYLKNEAEEIFQKTQDLNRYLIQKLVIQKNNEIYIPTNQYESLFIIDKYHGKIKGIKFKNEFLAWLEKHIKEEKKPQQSSLF